MVLLRVRAFGNSGVNVMTAALDPQANLSGRFLEDNRSPQADPFPPFLPFPPD